jgi:plasmid stabilization system protein ParE
VIYRLYFRLAEGSPDVIEILRVLHTRMEPGNRV